MSENEPTRVGGLPKALNDDLQKWIIEFLSDETSELLMPQMPLGTQRFTVDKINSETTGNNLHRFEIPTSSMRPRLNDDGQSYRQVIGEEHRQFEVQLTLKEVAPTYMMFENFNTRLETGSRVISIKLTYLSMHTYDVVEKVLSILGDENENDPLFTTLDHMAKASDGAARIIFSSELSRDDFARFSLALNKNINH